MERWATVREFPEYQVSDQGRVRKPASTRKKGAVIAPHVGRYRCVSLCQDARTHTRMISRLMLEAFVGPPPSSIHQAAHNDGNPMNDRLDNLRWATPKENCADRVKHGTAMRGETHCRALLRGEQVREIRARRRAGERNKTLAAEFGVSGPTISMIVNGHIWKHL